MPTLARLVNIQHRCLELGVIVRLDFRVRISFSQRERDVALW